METAEVTTTNSEDTTIKSEANSNDDNVNKTDETVCDNTEITPKPEPDLLNKASQQSDERQELTWESVAAEIQAHEESSSSQYEIIQPDTQTEEVNVLTSDDNTIQTTTITTTIEDTITTTTSSTTEVPIVTQSDTVENSIAQSTDDHLDNIEEIEMLIKSGENNLETKQDSNDTTNNVTNNEEKFVDKEQETEKTAEQTNENTKDETVDQVSTEAIEITELQADEMEQMDDVTGIEYTVIEAEESTEIMTESGMTTEEIVLLPIDDDTDPNRSEENSQDIIEEVFIIKNENVTTPTTDTSQTTIETVTTTKTATTVTSTEESVDDPEEKPKQTKPKKPRGRRPIADIPLHVLGRDISKPTEGVSNGGRTMPKPRLGVKVPYKNLTSQIVSKEEIQKEIMDRFKQRQEQSVASGDILFARKLTQRLAKRLGPAATTTTSTTTETTSTTTTAASTSTDVVTRTTTTSTLSHAETSQSEENNEKKTATKKGESETINPNMNNSDLIAILEGETDEPQIPEKPTESKVYSDKQQFYKDIEKEIALQQLSELPLTKNRIFKSRGQHQQHEANKTGTTTITTTNKSSNTSTPNKSSNTSTPNKINETPTTSNSTNTTKKTQETPTKTEKKNLDMEPQLKAEQVVKTYTRKRRSFELDTILSTKKSVSVKDETSTTNSQSPSDVYVTKSSRIIKKKVIWDPDETPTKSPTAATVTTISTRSASSSSPKQQTQQQQQQDSGKSPEKKPSMSPVKKTSTSPPKKPKRLTEVDRLLMDEGAVNMLYDVKQNDDKSKNKNKKVISLDKAHKELITKTNVIKNDLQQNTIKESGVSLRKKDTPSSPKKDAANIVTRKKSKDFNKNSQTQNSGGSPPASPSFSLAEASRIIRRHSSSSFSSNDGQIDGDNGENIKNKKQKTTVTNNEPPKKKFKKPTDVSNKTNIVNNNNNNNSNSSNLKIEKDTTKYKTFTVTKMNTLISIELNYTETKYYLTEKVLKELTVCLKELSGDNDCNVVSITSSGGDSFCHGLDYRCLVAEDVDVRKNQATELCNLIKDFIRCLLHFPKVLVAGIQGDCVGLGVTMLPLFDMVIASDTSTFSTPYGCLGCGPEAGFLLGIPYLNNHGLASELLYTSQTVKAEDAVRSGLVTRLCWPEKYHNELKSILVEIASQSRQSIEATKAQFRRHLFESTESLLNSSMDNLIEQWLSAECQKNFSKYKVELNN